MRASTDQKNTLQLDLKSMSNIYPGDDDDFLTFNTWSHPDDNAWPIAAFFECLRLMEMSDEIKTAIGYGEKLKRLRDDVRGIVIEGLKSIGCFVFEFARKWGTHTTYNYHVVKVLNHATEADRYALVISTYKNPTMVTWDEVEKCADILKMFGQHYKGVTTTKIWVVGKEKLNTV